MVELITELAPETVAANLQRVRSEIRGVGRDPEQVQILVAVKYLPVELLGALAEGGVTLVGENRAQELLAKSQAYPDRFTWDFIGQLQSRKVKGLLPHVRYIQTVASDSALEQLRRHGGPDTRVLVEVNAAGDATKAGVAPRELGAFLDRCPVTVAGLMTMPPLAREPEASRPHFRALRELAERHGLPELSMGTTQDYLVAVQEGATIIRLGSALLAAS